ncbi:hypothetical protein OHA59_08500 [Streptomyces sp. NBC_01589]|uniref:hypothetical protein n=1 Tax=Streptomyces sp. NBC_01589 TaxID=2975886 RepID=UPI0038672498
MLERAELLQHLVLLGEQARVLPDVPLKLLVFDRRDAAVPLTAGADGLRTTAPWSAGHRRATPSSTSSTPAGSRLPPCSATGPGDG